MYWEEQKDIKMDDKDENHHDKLVFVVQIVLIDEKSMQQIMNFFMEVKLDEHCLDLMKSGNKRCTFSNHETLTCTLTQQGVWEVVVLT
jgi:hypothetical protein